jgi:hypothetical protein
VVDVIVAGDVDVGVVAIGVVVDVIVAGDVDVGVVAIGVVVVLVGPVTVVTVDGLVGWVIEGLAGCAGRHCGFDGAAGCVTVTARDVGPVAGRPGGSAVRRPPNRVVPRPALATERCAMSSLSVRAAAAIANASSPSAAARSQR